MSPNRSQWPLILLPVLGVCFWFIVGFPMADRNESFIWITYLEQFSFAEIIQTPIPSIRNFRPLAQVATWSLYHLAGGSGILVQTLNFGLLCTAILTMVSLTPSAKLSDVRLLYLLMSILYFPTFAYVFNLHGIFYSVILLIVALLLKAGENVLIRWKKWIAISAILSFFHPLILVLNVAYMLGWLMQRRSVSVNRIIFAASALAIMFVLLHVLLPFSLFSVINVQNLLGTLRNLESHYLLKVFSLLLCALPFFGRQRRQQIWLLAIIVFYLPVALIMDLPILLLLSILILFNQIIEKNWALACLVAAAISFPLAVGSGSPTKASIFVFLLPYILTLPLPFSIINDDRIPRFTAALTIAGIVLCALVIRLEATIPVLSSLIGPVLVEKGKTYQLKSALVLATQQTPPRRILFLQEKQGNIRDRGQPKDRHNFPPTKQDELDVYQDYLLSGRASGRWYVVFGTEFPSDTLMLVHVLRERNCKPAYIYQARNE